jgi:RNA polymerase sigma factor (sigma-70 family)
MEETAQAGAGGGERFPHTRWSLILLANNLTDSAAAQKALAELYEIYQYPVYAFIRRRGYAHHDAKDLTQELFVRLIEKQFLQVADPEKGRFRSFLLSCVEHLLNKEWQKQHRLKRGGEYTFVPLDDATAEAQYGVEPVDPMSPEKIFEYQWALALLGRAMEQLKRHYEQAGKAAHFEALQPFLSGAREAPCSYADVASRLGLSEGAVRQAVYLMRRRFAGLLRIVVAETVVNPEDVEAELRHLRHVLSNPSGH